MAENLAAVRDAMQGGVQRACLCGNHLVCHRVGLGGGWGDGIGFVDSRRVMTIQPSSFKPKRPARRRRFPTWATLAALLVLGWSGALAQSDYHLSQIVWVVIGEAAGASPTEPVRAGRHLFMAKELADFNLKDVDVARVDAHPEVVVLAIGERFCVTSLKLAAFTAAGAVVKGAPMTISVRQDHKEPMGLARTKENICVKGVSAGEYPLRFSSLLPAKDGTNRGAQVFVRVREATAQATATRRGALEVVSSVIPAKAGIHPDSDSDGSPPSRG